MLFFFVSQCCHACIKRRTLAEECVAWGPDLTDYCTEIQLYDLYKCLPLNLHSVIEVKLGHVSWRNDLLVWHLPPLGCSALTSSTCC